MGFFSIIKDFFASSGFLAIPFFLCFSIVFVIIIERLIFFFFVFKQENAIALVKDVIVQNKSYPKQLREDLIEVELQDIERSLRFGLNILKFVAGISTMLGLLGTIFGMIDIFSAISTIKTAVSPAVISLGIKKAMYTTAYGLIIAIIALFASYIIENLGYKAFIKIEEYSILLNASTEYERLSKASKVS